jgi:hypothetical protein
MLLIQHWDGCCSATLHIHASEVERLISIITRDFEELQVTPRPSHSKFAKRSKGITKIGELGSDFLYYQEVSVFKSLLKRKLGLQGDFIVELMSRRNCNARLLPGSPSLFSHESEVFVEFGPLIFLKGKPIEGQGISVQRGFWTELERQLPNFEGILTLWHLEKIDKEMVWVQFDLRTDPNFGDISETRKSSLRLEGEAIFSFGKSKIGKFEDLIFFDSFFFSEFFRPL